MAAMAKEAGVELPKGWTGHPSSMLGKGWKMLLECLSIGRSISLPALGTGAGKLASLATGSYAYTREQFGRSISQFEGVQEALEPIAGYTYMMDAARLLTSASLRFAIRGHDGA